MASLEDVQKNIEKLKELAKQHETEHFFVKILRRTNEYDSATPWCNLNGATLEHIANSDEWLVPLIGKGKGTFDLQVYTPGTRTLAAVIFPRLYKANGTQDLGPQVELIDRPDWRGPSTLEFPMMSIPTTPTYNMPDPAPRTAPVILPPAPVPGRAAIETANSIGGGEAAYRKAMEAAEEIEKQKRELNEQRHRMDLEEKERIHKSELTAIHDKASREIEDLKRQFAAFSNQPRAVVEEKKVDLLDQIPKIIAALTPVVAPVMAMIKGRDDRMFETISNLEKKINEKKEDPAMAQLQAMTEATAKITASQINFLHAMSELNGDKEQPAWAVAISEVNETIRKGIDSYAAREMQQRTLTANQKAADANAITPGAAKQLPPPPARNGATNGAAPVARTQPAPTTGIVSELENLIRRHSAPEVVAARFFEALKNHDLSLAAALKQYEGDYETLLLTTLGQEWVSNPTNTAYLIQLAAGFKTESLKHGAPADDEVEEEEEAPIATPPSSLTSEAAPMPPLVPPAN